MLGKFLPFHKGHIALIDFARERCDELTILICAAGSEDIPGSTRLEWVSEFYAADTNARPVLIEYDENSLPNTSVSSRKVAKVWAEFIKEKIAGFDLVFSSEKYGDHLAEYLDARHIYFDPQRSGVPVSGTRIRANPLKFWDFLPANVQPYFVKKVCLIGTESTGKSTMAEKLANHFKTVFVPEMAREIIEKTMECTPEHLLQIADLHARAIVEAKKTANRLLFIDTDVNITRSYSRFLFGSELAVAEWVEKANRCDLYLYLESDSEYVQDGSRLDKKERDRLDREHQKVFDDRGIEFAPINGNWEEKFQSAVDLVSSKFL